MTALGAMIGTMIGALVANGWSVDIIKSIYQIKINAPVWNFLYNQVENGGWNQSNNMLYNW